MPQTREGRSPDQVIARRSGRRTLYDVLQVSARAEPAVLQAAYRALARANHPDLNPERDAAERMRELNDAYDLLNDPRRRAIYDLGLNRTRETDSPPDDPSPSGEQAPIKRRTSCWRCSDPLEASVSHYCGECLWVICEVCRGCGCQPPKANRRPSLNQMHQLPPHLGWVVAGLTAFGWLACTLIVWLHAFGAGVGG